MIGSPLHGYNYQVWEYSALSRPIRRVGSFPVVLPGTVNLGSVGSSASGGTESSHLSGHSVPELLTAYVLTTTC